MRFISKAVLSLLVYCKELLHGCLVYYRKYCSKRFIAILSSQILDPIRVRAKLVIPIAYETNYHRACWWERSAASSWCRDWSSWLSRSTGKSTIFAASLERRQAGNLAFANKEWYNRHGQREVAGFLAKLGLSTQAVCKSSLKYTQQRNTTNTTYVHTSYTPTCTPPTYLRAHHLHTYVHTSYIPTCTPPTYLRTHLLRTYIPTTYVTYHLRPTYLP